ncbi:MAG: hypothetical protein WEB04_06820 [Dehalococcoidia bacterium]
MAEFGSGRPEWRERLFGGRDSWRRVVLTGIGAGVVLAVAGAFAVAFINDSGGSALDKNEPTAIAPGSGGPVEEPPVEEFPTEPVEELPTDIPLEPVPTEPVFEEPTEPPFDEPTATFEPEPLPTEPAAGVPVP